MTDIAAALYQTEPWSQSAANLDFHVSSITTHIPIRCAFARFRKHVVRFDTTCSAEVLSNLCQHSRPPNSSLLPLHRIPQLPRFLIGAKHHKALPRFSSTGYTAVMPSCFSRIWSNQGIMSSAAVLFNTVPILISRLRLVGLRYSASSAHEPLDVEIHHYSFPTLNHRSKSSSNSGSSAASQRNRCRRKPA